MGNEFQIEKIIFTSINLIDNILNLIKEFSDTYIIVLVKIESQLLKNM